MANECLAQSHRSRTCGLIAEPFNKVGAAEYNRSDNGQPCDEPVMLGVTEVAVVPHSPDNWERWSR